MTTRLTPVPVLRKTAGIEPLEVRTFLSAYGYDTSFGTNGLSELPLPDPTFQSETMIVGELSDGGILLATEQRGLLVSRFEPDGTLVQTYGTDGTATFDAWSIDAAAITADDKLVFLGQLDAGEGAFIARFTPDGQLDSTFAGDGVAEYSSTDGQLTNQQVTVEADGTITVLGLHSWGAGQEKLDYIVRRFTSAGALDTSFSGDGVMTGGREDLKTQDGAPTGGALGVDSQGRTVISVLVNSGMLVTRLTEAGEIDSSFGTAGSVVLSGVTEKISRLAFQDDGKIVIAAAHRLARLTDGGAPDTDFSGDGVASQSGYTITDLQIGDDGKITLIATQSATEVYRFLTDGSADPNFDSDSDILYYTRAERKVSPDFAIFDADGDIIGGGDAYGGDDSLPRGRAVARFEPVPDVFVDSQKVLQVRCTAIDDTLTLALVGGQLELTRNGEVFTYSTDEVVQAQIALGDGDNTITLSVPIMVWISAGSGNDRIDGSAMTGRLIAGFGGSGSGDGNDTLLGGSAADELGGGGGDDYFDGGAGKDIISDFAGNNSLIGGDGDDRITSGDGDDTLIGGAGRDSLQAGDGTNLIQAGDGDDYLKAGAGNDTFYGGAGADSIRGGDGDNLLYGGDGDDTIWSGEGSDTIWGEIGYDHVRAGYGDDLINGGAGKDRIWGQGGNDRIYGRRNNDAMDGGPGDDRLVGDEGFDKFHGWEGNDYFFARDGAADSLDGGADDDTAERDELLDELTSIEIVRP